LKFQKMLIWAKEKWWKGQDKDYCAYYWKSEQVFFISKVHVLYYCTYYKFFFISKVHVWIIVLITSFFYQQS
jgi:hypothetical protein